VKEVTLQGGLNPQLGLDYHTNMLKTVKLAFPSIQVNAYTPSEIKFISVRSGKTFKEVLSKFKAAGLDSMSGGSAQVLNDKIRRKIAQDKLKTAEWIEIIRTAHSLEIPTSASILVGHIEDEIYIAEHLDILKRIQSETRYFTSLEIVPFVPKGSQLESDKRVKRNSNISRLLGVCAVSRLFFGELVKNIHVPWGVAGLDTTMAAFRAGCNDLGYLTADPADVRNPSLNGRTSVAYAMLKSAVARLGKTLVERPVHQIKKPKYAIPAPRYDLETALV
jgi:CofH subfamily radical SAM domain protein